MQQNNKNRVIITIENQSTNNKMREIESHDAMGKLQRCVKRAFDFAAALVGLIICFPLFLLIGILITYQSNGPIFFRQIRIGYKGRPFAIFKFRTMSSVVEEEGPQLVAKCDNSNSTRLEQFLRGHHLDELPQLWNVLRGDMSFVGPRPERKFFIDKIMERTDRYQLIYEMRPGLTSEATLYNGYTDTMEKMLRRMEMDIHYLEHRTLWLDFTIIIKTVLKIVIGKKF
ncbi:bacterial sugar transferase [Prevotella sp. F0091]|mgnify:FL=1|nr:bacterial sugar transferase [Prevotella sp. F0091]